MKKSLKCLSVILVMLITLFSFSITALAQTTEKDGLQVSLSTDKQNYSLNEDVTVTISVTNTNDFTVEDVSIEALLPDNFTLKDNQKTKSKSIDLQAGEQTSLTVVAFVKSDSQGTTTEPTTKPKESTTDNNQTTKPSINQITTDTSDKSDKNINSKNNKNGTSPYTGADYTFMGIFIVLFLASVATLFYCLIKHFKKTTKIVSSALCAVIAVTSVIGFSTFKAYADETKSTISVNEQIKVDSKDYTITANVSYRVSDTVESSTILDGYLHSYPTSCNVGERTDVTFYFEILSDYVSENKKIEFYIDNELAGYLNNEGLDGDITADDNIYSGTFSMFSNERKFVECYVNFENDKNQENNTYSFQYYKSATDIEQKTIDDFYIDISHIKDNYRISEEEKNNNENLALSKAENCYNEIIKYLQNRSDVEKFGFSGFNIMVDFDFGITVGIPFEDLVEYSVNNVISLRSVTTKNSIDNISFYKSKIATLQPHYYDLNTTAFDDAATTIAKNNNYIFSSNLDDSQVTIETMKSLSEYDIVIIDSHGGNWTDYGYIISLSETVTPEKNAKYENSGDLYRTIIPNGNQYVLTEKFFDEYYSKNDFDNTMIYLGTCHGGDDNVKIQSILNEKGAEAVLTYKNTVLPKYNREMITTISERLSEGDTIQEAVKKAKQENGEHDPYISRDEYNSLGFWKRLWYRLGFIESSNPAELILTGNNLSFSLISNMDKGALTGKICKASDRDTPIENAKVSIYQKDRLYETVKTNNTGNYSVDLPSGEYFIVISADGYLDFSSYATLENNETKYMETFLMINGSETQQSTASGTITNALSGSGINGVNLSVRKGWNNSSNGNIVTTLTTDENGNYSVNLPLGNYTVYAEKDGYVSTTINILVQNGTTTQQNGAMSPVVSGDSFTIVLTWGENPRDLDSHVVGKLSNDETFHTYYRDMYANDGNITVCSLDVDDTTSYGPETITLNATTSSPYYYYIHRYEGSGSIANSNAQIKVYSQNKLITTFNAPTDKGNGDYWNVFAVVEGKLIISNTITDEANLNYAKSNISYNDATNSVGSKLTN